MNRTGRIPVALGAALVCALALFWTLHRPSTAQALDATIKVPDDYDTIQAAINASENGDTILVAAGLYMENLTITKSIDLSGGWDPTFESLSTGASVIDGGGQGRVIYVMSATTDTLVTISGFTIQNGDAGGQGAPVMPELPITLPVVSQASAMALHAEGFAPAAQMEQAQARFTDLAARGLFPGGHEALATLTAQLAQRTIQAEQAHNDAVSTDMTAAEAPDAGVGGGVYSENAGLHLIRNIIRNNVATQYGDGVGGGVYVVNGPEDGVRIIDNIFVNNVAGKNGKGWGGGLYVYQVPGVLIEGNEFLDNIAVTGSDSDGGVGGGLGVHTSSSARILNNRLERNTASMSWNAEIGTGGGMYVVQSHLAELRGNVLRSNLAGLRNHGNGGGLFLAQSDNVQLVDNTFENNWAAMFGHDSMNGGGALLVRANGSQFTGNRLSGNIACVYVRGIPFDNCSGGGLLVGITNDSEVSGNTFSGNVAALTHIATDRAGFPSGGGALVQDAYGVALTGNTFEENVASLTDLTGSGGGLAVDGSVNTSVSGNVFRENRGGTEIGFGGALALGGTTIDIRVEANLFLRNHSDASLEVADVSDGGACNGLLITDALFVNNVVAGNTALNGGGFAFNVARNSRLINNTFVDNTDSGIHIEGLSSAELINNIVVSQTVGVRVNDAAVAMISYTLWDNNGTDLDGTGTITQTHAVTGTPAFVAPTAYDYRLTAASAAKDAGDPAGVPPAPAEDHDGVARPQGPAVDIGAYEWQGAHIFLPVIR